MDPELATFLQSRTTDFEQPIMWRGGEHRLYLRGYFTTDVPPDAFVLAGKALVIEKGQVLVVRDPEGEHVLPGGRREAGESAVGAAHREVVEETGWSISSPVPLSVLHLHYETPQPASIGRVMYPDFLWQVFAARPSGFDAAARHTDGYELGAAFHPITEQLKQRLPLFHRILLAAAIRVLDRWAT
jgi:8-oxo-dGTP pyrophosphatase MutT (NUDIX family)